MSSLSFNFVAMSFYDHVCFFQHIRSAFPYVNSSAALFLAEVLLRVAQQLALAETCYVYSQYLPTIVTLVQAWLALLLSFFGHENLGYFSLTSIRVSHAAMEHFFDEYMGALSAHA